MIMSMRLFASVLAATLPLCAPVNAAGFDAAAAVNDVGLDLFRQLAGARPATNLVISPYSIESAMVLAHAGADGITRAEMTHALHLPDDDAGVQRAFASLRTRLAAATSHATRTAKNRERGTQVYTVQDGKRVELIDHTTPPSAIEWHVANRLFAQRGYPMREAFLSLMRDGYGAPLQLFDFKSEAESARANINQWVSEQTRDRIRELIPLGGVSKATRLVLVNALYLKAPWDTPFPTHLTTPRQFHPSAGGTRKVATMLRGGHLAYAHENGVTVVALDYLGRDLRCIVVLPDETQSVEGVAAKLTAADFTRWAKLGERGETRLVTLYLPKFRVEGTTMSLASSLRGIGIKSAFDQPPGSADFGRIATRKRDEYLYLSEVYHQTFIALNEEGTEAAAATAASVSLGAAMITEKPIEVRVDRPFLFAIQHRATGLCLFLGRITDPR
jgi:serpin B